MRKLFLWTALLLISISYATGEEPRLQILWQQETSLKENRSYIFKFSLWDSEVEGAELWTEQKQLTVSPSGSIKHYLGSITPLPRECFGMQLWVQLEKLGSRSRWSRVGKRQKFYVVPYSASSASVLSGGVGTDALQDGAVTDAKIAGTISAAKLQMPPVAKIQNVPVSSATPATNQVLKFNGTEWVPSNNLERVDVEQGGGLLSGDTGSAINLAVNFGGSGSASTVSRSDHSHYLKTLVVSPIGTSIENGAALLATLDSITDASSSNPYLVKIEPGIFDVGTSPLVMKQYVDIEGSGKTATTINGDSGNVTTRGVLVAENNSELRNLTVKSSSNGGSVTVAFYCQSKSPRVSDVEAIAAGASTSYGFYLTNACNGTFRNVDATSSAESYAEGLYISSANPTIFDSTATVSGGSLINRALTVLNEDASPVVIGFKALASAHTGIGEADAVYIHGAGGDFLNLQAKAMTAETAYGIKHEVSSANIVGARAIASGTVTNSTGLYVYGDTTARITGANVQGTASTGTAYGMFVVGAATMEGSSPRIENVTAYADGATVNNYGIYCTNTKAILRGVSGSGLGGNTKSAGIASDSAIDVSNSSFEGKDNTAENNGIFISGSTSRFTNIRATARGGNYARGISAGGPAQALLSGGATEAWGASDTNIGAYGSGSAVLEFDNLHITGLGGTNAYGVRLEDSHLSLIHGVVNGQGGHTINSGINCTSTGAPYAVSIMNSLVLTTGKSVNCSNMYTAKIGNSVLRGAPTAGTGLTCANVIDGNFNVFAGPACP